MGWHTNTIELFFALITRGVSATFTTFCEAHLHLYLAEFDFRDNDRAVSVPTAPTPCCVRPGASASRIDNLTKPRTAKQKARAFLRWRACRESE